MASSREVLVRLEVAVSLFLFLSASNASQLTPPGGKQIKHETKSRLPASASSTALWRRSLLSATASRGRSLKSRKSKNVFRGCQLWVDQNGGNNHFTTIQAAIDQAGGDKKKKICIKPGTYYETLHVKDWQHNLKLVGAGKELVKIVGGSSASKYPNHKTFYAATLVVEGNNFLARRLTIENPSKTTWDPSPAVTLLGQYSTWHSVELDAWIDTIGVFTSKHLFRNCVISGLADIIWGFGRIGFDNCNIKIRDYYDPSIRYVGYITAMGTDWPSNGVTAGAVFYKCRIDGNAKAYLGRPYRPKAIVAYTESYIGNVIPNGVWSDFNGYAELGQVEFREFNTYGPGAALKTVNIGSYISSDAPWDLQLQNFLN